MQPDFLNPDVATARTVELINDAFVQVEQICTLLDSTAAATRRVLLSIEAALKAPVQQNLNAPVTPPDAVAFAAQYRRQHRPGTPSKITADPELQAVIRARINTLTYAQIIAELAAAFPPERRVSHSSLARWWQANRPNPKASIAGS